MYGPPLRRKRKNEDEQVGSARMYAALGVVTPDLDGMRFALLLTKVSAFEDFYLKQVLQNDG
jgi:hypothetical protein